MHTPQLESRIVTAGVAVVAAVVVAVDVFLFAGLRTALTDNLDGVLDERARVAAAEAAHSTPADLADRLRELGIRATVHDGLGHTYESDPASPALGGALPPGGGAGPSSEKARQTPLAGAGDVVVYARSGAVHDALRHVVELEAVGLGVALLIAMVALSRLSALVLRPLRDMGESARRTAAGQRGARLRPDEPATTLGQLAMAYDEMLDALETSIGEAHASEQESARLYRATRTIIDTAAAGYLATDAGGTVVEWNHRAASAFGLPADQAIGRHVKELVEGFPGPAPIDCGRFTGIRADGRRFPIEMSMWQTDDHATARFSAFIEDVTEREKGQLAVGRLAAIVESAHEAIFSESLDGTILTWNEGAASLYGFTAAEAVGMNASILAPADAGENIESFRAYARRGTAVPRFETCLLSKGGVVIDVALTISPIRDDRNEVVAISTIARDLTEYRWLAETLNSTLARLEAALTDARRAEERSRRFLADAAHQLRTPISGVQASAEAVLLGADETQREELLGGLVREALRARRVVASLLRLARLDQGETLAPEQADIVALAEGELERTRLFAPHLKLDLKVSPLDTPVIVDPEAVREVLGNLLDNAKRHAIRVISVTIAAAGEMIEMRVANDGPPVKSELIEQIFERFVSLDGNGGSGLGLPIARELARAHGGDLVYTDGAFVLTLGLRRSGGSPPH